MKEKNILLYFLVAVRFALPYFIQNSIYEPHRDELLYLAEGHHLAWGFMEIPPLLSCFALFTHLLGDGLFWIKFWPSLFGAATFFIMGKLVISFRGNKFSLLILFLSSLFSVYLRLFFLFQPNSLEVFFWTMMGYAMLKFVETNNKCWFYVFGASAGFGIMSKYSAVFYIISLLAALLLSKYRRKIFMDRHFWIGVFLGFIIFLPNLIWQWSNHFPVVYHMKLLRESQLQYIGPQSFLIGQILLFVPCFFVWIIGLYNLLFSKESKRFSFIAIAYFFTIIILMIGKGKDYYASGLYPLLLAFGATTIGKATGKVVYVLKWFATAHILIWGILVIPVSLPCWQPEQLSNYYKKFSVLKPALKWEDLEYHPLPQDFADMLGWKELAEKASKAYKSLSPEQQKQTILFCNNYGMAGALSYYGKKYGLPEAYCDDASFLNWIPANVPMNNLLLLCSDSDELSDPYIKSFKTARFTDSLTNKYAREHGDYIMLATDGGKEFEAFLKKQIHGRKVERLGAK
ncbi:MULTISPECIES: glycosyltransferase family 39 protein [Chitinophagaceae]